jgi:hypothetical protein
MRRVVPFTAIVLMTVMTPAVVNAAPARDSLVGNGSNPVLFSAQVSAKSGPSGEDAKGHWTFDDGFSDKRKIDVTCLAVIGNRAVVGGPRPDAPGNYQYLIVEDNGADGDRMSSLSTLLVADQVGCALVATSTFPLDPVDDGNFTVNDAIP